VYAPHKRKMTDLERFFSRKLLVFEKQPTRVIKK
jgi:hypothetical protein